MFASLTPTSPRFEPPIDCGLLKPLYLHQKANLWAMRRLEDSVNQEIKLINLDPNISFKTRLGILADKPGAGKSFTMMAHLLSKPAMGDVNKQHIVPFLDGYIDVKQPIRSEHHINSNLILVPRNAMTQWALCIKEMTNSEGIVVIDSLTDDIVVNLMTSKYQVVIVSDAVFKTFPNILLSSFFERFIIDEADNITISNCHMTMIKARFTWLISSAPYILYNGNAKTLALRKIFSKSQGLLMDQAVTVASDSAFVDECLQLPTIEFEEVVINVFEDDIFVDKKVMDAIEAHDYTTAVNIFGCKTAKTDEEVIDVATNKQYESLQNQLTSVDMTHKIACITNRLKESRCCPIGLDAIVVKATSMCCQNKFEFSNLMKALEASGRCPICKTQIGRQDIIVSGETFPSFSADDKHLDINPKYNTKSDAINDVLINIFRTNNQARVLVYNEYEQINIPFRFGIVKGNKHVISSMLREFNDLSSSLRIISLNEQHFGVGLDLPVTTHIVVIHYMESFSRYVQVIGRAQRPGRKEPLKVINIRFSLEMSNGTD